jgi:DedD protein
MTALFEDNFDVHDPVEVHWSTSTILAIFFAASLVSAVFFGLGYSFGGAGTGKQWLASNAAPPSSSATASTILPAQSNPSSVSNQPSPIANVVDNVNAHSAESPPSTPPVALHSVATTPIAHIAAPMAETKRMPAPATQHEDATASEKSSTHIMVQVGAIGNRKDAERLVAELRKKGFHAGIYAEKNDKFLHVQIGPFKDVAQAQSKRHQVMASGFHAILKSS